MSVANAADREGWWTRHPGWLDALALLLIVLAARLPSLWTSVIDPDEDIFALAAGSVLQGNLPYLGFFDIKPVGSTLMVAAAFVALGKSLVSLRLLGAACVWATGLLLRRLTLDAGWSGPLAFATALLYVAFSTGLHGLATMTEIMLAPFTVGCVVLLMRLPGAGSLGRCLLLVAGAGLLCGLAVLIKLVPIVPGGLALASVLLAMLLARPSRVLELVLLGAVFSLGAALPMAATGLVYWQAGEWKEFFYANIGFTRVYVADDMTAKTAARDVIRVGAEIWPLLLLSCLAALGAAQGLLARRRLPLLILVSAAWAVGEVAAASATGHYYGHYFLMLLPPLCVLAAQGTVSLHAWLGSGSERPTVALCLAAALTALAPMWARTVPEMVGAKDLYQRAAQEIRGRAAGHRPTLFVTGQEQSVLYLLTGADPPSRFAQPVQLLSSQTALLPADPKVELARILATRPEFIVVNRDTPFLPWVGAQVEPALAQGYRPVAHLPDFLVIDVGITRRNDLYIYQRTATAP